jgi:hypothetical protein
VAVGLQIKVGADVTGLMGAFQAAAGGAGSLGETLKATVASMHPAAAAGVAVADALVGMTEAAAADRAEQEKLNALYVTATGATGDYTTAIQAAIDAGADKAFGDSEVRAGLESLVVATGNAEQANALLGPAMDIARLAGVDLETASKALAKAHGGNDAALAKLIPGLAKGATAADTIAAATELAAGQADLYSESAEGMKEKGSNAFGELSEQIGSVFLPIMDELLPAIIPIVEILGELITAVLPLLKPAISLIVGALKIFIQVLNGVISGIKTVMGFIGDLVGKFQEAAGFIGSIDLNPFSLPGGEGGAYPAPTGRGRAGRSGGGGGSGGTTVNVQVATADPEQVVRAIRRWAGRNGGAAPFNRALERGVS